MLVKTPQLGRRHFVGSALVTAGLAAGGALPMSPSRAQQARLAATPAQTEGPFYPVAFPADSDNDLVQVRGSEARAQGIVTHVNGRLTGPDGKPIANAKIEIWQCDARGNYLHPGSRGGGARDTAFQGFGRTLSAADGSYRFRTIKPVPYPGRTPHIHFSILAPDRRALVTQMYVAGEAQNARDGIYRSLGQRSDLVTVRFDPANGIEDGALAGEFNIVL